MVLVLALTTSCIYEDISECYKDLAISYDFTVESTGGTVTEEQFKADAKNLSVFVFEGKGLYVGVWYFNMEEVRTTSKLPINLPFGTYTMVMWGGILPNQYSVGSKEIGGGLSPLQAGVSKLEDFQLKVLESKPGNVVDAMYENLYHSISSGVEVKDKVNTKVVLPVKKVSNDIVVKLYGLPRQEVVTYSSEFSYVQVLLMASNGLYNYDNTVSDNAPLITYLPYRRVENVKEDCIEVELRTMDIFAVSSPRLIVKNSISGVEMYNYNLRGLIQQIPDPEKQTKYVVELFYNTHGSVTLKVNGWVVVPIYVKI